jgi:hypothetical protein
MSLYVYLHTEGDHIDKTDSPWTAFKGTPLQATVSDKKMPSISISPRFLDRPEDFPHEMLPHVRDFSLYEEFYGEGASKERRTGEYQMRSARAVITVAERFKHKVRVFGPDLGDIAELYAKIRAGTIAPATSYEEKQVKGGLVGAREAFAQLVLACLRGMGCRIA